MSTGGSTAEVCKMADIDVRLRQRCVIEFLNAEGETPIRIHERLKKVYGVVTVDVSTVRRWVRRCKEAEGQTPLTDEKRSGRPVSAVTPHNIQQVDDIIRGDRRVTADEVCRIISLSKGSVITIIKQLGYSKVCARWVPRMLTDQNKEARKTIASQHLQRFRLEGDEFLKKIVTGDETWVHFFEPESKRQSMEWRHTSSPRKKKFKTVRSAGKVMATVFWDTEGVILVDFLEQGCTINSVQYVTTLKKLKARLQRVRPTKSMADVLLLHDNARPHTSRHTSDEIVKIGWEVLPHPPYSPDLAPSDFHLFGPLKEAHRGIHFEDEEAVKTSVRQWLRKQSCDFYRAGIHALVQRWTKTVEMGGDYIEK